MGLRVCLGCSKAVPASESKRCNRCKQAIYCSRECQVKQWKTHKIGCVLYAELVPPVQDPNNAAQVNDRTLDIKADEMFGKWVNRWWFPITRMAFAGLDIGNYPERAHTHCMVVWAMSNPNHRGSSSNAFRLELGGIKTIKELKDESLIEESPTDLQWSDTSHGAANKPSIVVLRCLPNGKSQSGRWHYESAENFAVCETLFSMMPRAMSSAVARTWFDWLKYWINNRHPDELIRGRMTHAKFDEMLAEVAAIREREIGHTFRNEEPRDFDLYISDLFFRKMFL